MKPFLQEQTSDQGAFQKSRSPKARNSGQTLKNTKDRINVAVFGH
jgi:hypothetical protein